jgi:hypothetical protein
MEDVEDRVLTILQSRLATAAGTIPSVNGCAGLAASTAGDMRVIAEAQRHLNRLAANRPDQVTKEAAFPVRCASEIGP